MEEFGLLWFGTDSGHASVQGTFGIASADIGSGTFLRIFDTASHPDFTDTLGGEYTVSAFGMAIENIKFNHDPASSEHDALNIRQDHSVPFDISTGEWVKDGQNLPVAYCMNCSVAIKARFSVFPASVTTADIWATPLAANSSLGGVQRTTIHFANGISVGDEDGFVELPVLEKHQQQSVKPARTSGNGLRTTSTVHKCPLTLHNRDLTQFIPFLLRPAPLGQSAGSLKQCLDNGIGLCTAALRRQWFFDSICGISRHHFGTLCNSLRWQRAVPIGIGIQLYGIHANSLGKLP